MRPSVQLLSDGIHPTYSVAYGLATASIVSRTGLHIPTDGYEYTPKKGVAFSLTAQALVRRLVALVPPPRRHLTSFHGVYAPHAALRPLVTLPPPPTPAPPQLTFASFTSPEKKRKPRLDWATLHQRTFGIDVLRCPCGGRRSIRALHSTRKTAEDRLASLGISLPSRLLPPATAPPQLQLPF